MWVGYGKDAVSSKQLKAPKDNNLNMLIDKSKQIKSSSSSSSSSNGIVCIDVDEKANDNNDNNDNNDKDVDNLYEDNEVTMHIDDILYDKGQSNTNSTIFTLPESIQPSLINEKIMMKKYQLQALHWMKEREKDKTETATDATATDGSNIEIIITKISTDGFIDGSIESNNNNVNTNPLWQCVVGVKMNPDSVLPQQLSTVLLDNSNSSTRIALWWNKFAHKLSLQSPKLPQPTRYYHLYNQHH